MSHYIFQVIFTLDEKLFKIRSAISRKGYIRYAQICKKYIVFLI
jgi:hypothetical protein